MENSVFTKTRSVALASVAQLVGHWPIDQEVAGGFDSQQGMYRGSGFSPWSGHVQKATDRCFSLTLMFVPLSLSLPFSLESMGMSLGED